MGKYPDDYVSEFMRRTQANLHLVQSVAAAEGESRPAYGVTQLVNSLLGLLLLPRERAIERIKNIQLDDSRLEFLPVVHAACSTCGQVRSLGEYIRLLRNGVAHFNITFKNDDRDITELVIRNKDRGRVTHTFTFTVADMELFAKEFPRLLEEAGR